MKDIREEIIKAFREKCGNNNLKFPDKIDVKKFDNCVEICLKKDSLDKNLQEDEAAFEGWAFVIYCYYLNKKGKIILDIEKCAEEIETIKFFKDGNVIHKESLFNEHLNCMRFLYRVLKFKKQYDWFSVSEDLSSIVKNFSEFLANNEMINNVPKKESENNSKENSEKYIENFFKDNKYELYDIFKKNDIPFERENDIYNQLPVGLFVGDAKKVNRVFNGRNAAIDLWTYKDSEINIIELKVCDNKKVGIISEIFFYANYINDLIIEKENNWVLNQSNGKRGYNEIKSGKFEKINAVMLVPKGEGHPIITEEFIKAMNDNNINDKIKYYLVEY